MTKVLVLGTLDQTVLAVARSLGRQGIAVHLAWCPEPSVAERSRYVTAVHRLPSYADPAPIWREAMLDLVKRERFCLVLPCDDPPLLALADHRDFLPDDVAICLPNAQALRAFFDKRHTHVLAQRLGIPVAQQISIETPADVARGADRFGLPLIVKPPSTFARGELSTRRAVQKLYSVADVQRAVAGMVASGPVTLQQNFVGVGVGIGLLARDGEILVPFEYMRVHEPLLGGGSSYRCSMPVNRDRLEAAARLVSAVHYTGVMMVEFKVNLTSGEWILIETNARFWGSLPLAIAAGVDFPRYLYEMLIDGRSSFPCTYRSALYARNWSADLRWQVANARANRRDPTLMTKSLPSVASEMLNVVRGRERSDSFAVDDVRPAVAEVSALAGVIWDRVAGIVLKRLDSLRVVRVGRRRRLSHDIGVARRIVFVCAGNISRSAFAEEWFRRIAPIGVNVESGGWHQVSGRPPPDAAITAAGEHTVDLRRHRSRTLTRDRAEWAEVILVFERRDRRMVVRRFPSARRKVRFVGAGDGALPLEIADPHGGSLDVFRCTFVRIRSSLDAVAEDLGWRH